MGDASLVEVVVVRVSPYLRDDRPLLWLGEKEVTAPRLLPIAIGEFEAAAIQMPLEGEDPVRPISYDLLSSMLKGLGVSVDHVVIESVQKSIFLARVVILQNDGTRSIDSRPSDAVALALRTGAPIYVTSELLQEVGMGPLDADEDVERNLDQFHQLEPQITPARHSQGDNLSAEAEPAGGPAAEPTADELPLLHSKLQQAIICEEYEEAARLRDQIESSEDRCAQ